MAKSPEEYAHLEWLGYVQPIGLVVSVPAMLQAQCYVNKNILGEHARFLDCLPRDEKDNIVPEIADFAALLRRQLPVSFNDNYVFLVPLSSSGRKLVLAPMGAAEVYVNSQGYAACQACVNSSGEAQFTALHAAQVAGFLGFTARGFSLGFSPDFSVSVRSFASARR